MTQLLDSLLAEIRFDLFQMTSIRRIYDSVPESLNEFPAVIVAAMGGRCWLSSHGRSNGNSPMMCVHDIRVEIHIPRKDLQTDTATATAIADELVFWLYDGFVTDKFNGTMITTGDPRTANNATAPIDYTLGPAQWAGQQTYMVSCNFQVTTEREVAE